jgi:hypothetical protein
VSEGNERAVCEMLSSGARAALARYGTTIDQVRHAHAHAHTHTRARLHRLAGVCLHRAWGAMAGWWRVEDSVRWRREDACRRGAPSRTPGCLPHVRVRLCNPHVYARAACRVPSGLGAAAQRRPDAGRPPGGCGAGALGQCPPLGSLDVYLVSPMTCASLCIGFLSTWKPKSAAQLGKAARRRGYTAPLPPTPRCTHATRAQAYTHTRVCMCVCGVACQVRLGEKEALDAVARYFEDRADTQLKRLVYYQVNTNVCVCVRVCMCVCVCACMCACGCEWLGGHVEGLQRCSTVPQRVPDPLYGCGPVPPSAAPSSPGL